MGPSDAAVRDAIVKHLGNGNLVLSLTIEHKGSSRAIGNDIKAYPVKVKINYIQGGMGEYGMIAECPTAQCLKDFEYDTETEYLIGKDQWDAWNVFDAKQISGGETATHWRPTSASLDFFYKDRIKLN